MDSSKWKYLLEKVMNGDELIGTESAMIIDYLSVTSNTVRVAAMSTALMCQYCNPK